jgi:hypothetical protein
LQLSERGPVNRIKIEYIKVNAGPDKIAKFWGVKSETLKFILKTGSDSFSASQLLNVFNPL